MVHRTSYLSFGKLTGSTQDKLLFHSSGKEKHMKYFNASSVMFLEKKKPKKILSMMF